MDWSTALVTITGIICLTVIFKMPNPKHGTECTTCGFKVEGIRNPKFFQCRCNTMDPGDLEEYLKARRLSRGGDGGVSCGGDGGC